MLLITPFSSKTNPTNWYLTLCDNNFRLKSHLLNFTPIFAAPPDCHSGLSAPSTPSRYTTKRNTNIP